jgi:hypothetical protein
VIVAQASSAKERGLAIRRGLEFVYAVARQSSHFDEHGSDLLSCFHFISTTSRDPKLRRAAREMGRERARLWRRDHASLPADADAETVSDFVYGSYAADRLGVRDPALKDQLRLAARAFTARDFLSFDPRDEPPPLDVPDQCDHCDEWSARGRKTCAACRRRLSMLSRYVVWYDALMRTYSGERYGVRLGARYGQVLEWLPHMRPYRGREADTNPDFYDTVYAVTHVVYTLNDYSRYRLSPRWLPEEFAFLKSVFAEAVEMEDAEMVGEIMDSLQAFGLGESHPLVRAGVAYLLSRQNEDGSWGEQDDDYIYGRYHPTWTAIDGLREYAWRGARLSFPRLMPLLSRRKVRRGEHIDMDSGARQAAARSSLQRHGQRTCHCPDDDRSREKFS